jgi:hypothetical protein
MEEQMANKKAIRALIAYLEKLPPQNYDQCVYFCGTTACLAGHEALRLGWKYNALGGYVKRGGQESTAFIVAKVSLRLTGYQAGKLFNANTGLWKYGAEFRRARTDKQRLAVAIKELETYLR